MLQIKILAVGKIREKYLKEAVKEYVKRLSGYIRLEISEVEDEPCPEKAFLAEEEKIKEKEADRLLKSVSGQEFVILLDIKGKELSSPELADLLENNGLNGRSNITFIIGGSLGVSDRVKKRADFSWSFSRLTFPHQLMRVVLLEQIYRACKINRGETYHK